LCDRFAHFVNKIGYWTSKSDEFSLKPDGFGIFGVWRTGFELSQSVSFSCMDFPLDGLPRGFSAWNATAVKQVYGR
jgi:hypothetical protein